MEIKKMYSAYKAGKVFSDQDVITGYNHFSALEKLLRISGDEFSFTKLATSNLVDYFARIIDERNLKV